MSADWERGYDAGYRAALSTAQRDIGIDLGEEKPSSKKRVSKKPRKPTADNKAYARAFKKVEPKFKKKNGGWVKDGFKRCAAAARKSMK